MLLNRISSRAIGSLLAVFILTAGSLDAGDLDNWTQHANGAPWQERVSHTCVFFNGNLWVMGGFGGQSGARIRFGDVWFSPDGSNWNLMTAGAPWGGRSRHTSVVFDEKMWIIGGSDGQGDLSDVWYSSDGVRWTEATAEAPWGPLTGHASVAFDDKIWVIGGDGGDRVSEVWSSPDGVTWTAVTLQAPWAGRSSHRAVVHDGRIWLTGGIGEGEPSDPAFLNDVWSTSDGVAWTQATAEAPWTPRSNHASVSFDDKLWVMGGSRGKEEIWYSTDGAQWTESEEEVVWTGRSAHTVTVFGAQLILLGGSGPKFGSLSTIFNDVFSSSDGLRWTELTNTIPWYPRFEHTSASHEGRLWVLGGILLIVDDVTVSTNDVWSSADGEAWDPIPGNIAPWPPSYGHTSLSFAGRIWVLGGLTQFARSNEVWSSPDGAQWTMTNAQWRGRDHHSSVVFDSKMWVLGGFNSSDVWRSEDGATWTEATSEAPWGPRWGHTSAVHDGRMWILGGRNFDLSYGDVWASDDGVNWTRIIDDAPWGSRVGHASVAFDEKIWVIGARSTHSDLWSSPDGAIWTEVIRDAPWSARHSHTAVTHNGRLWIIGGDAYFGDEPALNEVWSTPLPVNAASHWERYDLSPSSR